MVQKAESGLYFIAIVPNVKICDEVQLIKNEIYQSYGSKASLNSPPHITLHMPFDWKLKKESILVKKLETFSESVEPCTIELKNFNCFEPRVIYINVEMNLQLMVIQKLLFTFCKQQLNLYNSHYKSLPFHPHITIAFRDLKKPMFYKAWDHYKTKIFSTSFVVEKLTLLKHNGNQWDIYHQFPVMPNI